MEDQEIDFDRKEAEPPKPLPELVIRLDGVNEPFVAGGSWIVRDKETFKGNLFKMARDENTANFDDEYSGVALLETSENNDNRAFGLFKEVPRKAHSLAYVVAKSLDYTLDIKSGNAASLNAIFYHLNDDDGKQVVWLVIVDRGIVQTGEGDNVYEVDQSFEVQNSLVAEYPGVKIRRVNTVRESRAELKRIWESLDKKARAATKILPFTYKRTRILKMVGAVLLLLVMGVIAWRYYESYQAEQREILRRQQIEREAGRKIAALKKSEFPPVWMKEPYPSMVFSSFLETIRETPISVNGWKLAGFRYAKGKIDISYTRGRTAPFMEPPGKVNVKKPLFSVVSKSLPKWGRERTAGILRKENAERWLMQISLGHSYKATYRLLPVETKTVKVGKTSVKVTASYQRYTVTLSGIHTLSGLGELLDTPGFVVNEMTYKAGAWRVMGTLYFLYKAPETDSGAKKVKK